MSNGGKLRSGRKTTSGSKLGTTVARPPAVSSAPSTGAPQWARVAPFRDPEDSLSYLLWQLYHGWMRRLNGALAGVAMTHLQFIVLGLTAFFTQENPRPQARIAEYCAMDPMLLSKIMRTLEQKRLIVRRPDPLDTRIKLVSLAPAGDALLARSIPLFAQAYDEFFAPVGADAPAFHAVLMRLLRAMQSRENVAPTG